MSLGSASFTRSPVAVENDLTNLVSQLFAIPERFGCIADGDTAKTDNAVGLQNALDSGRPVYLDPNKNYAFGAQLTIPSNGGFVGRGKLLMLTGTGKFDSTTYLGTFANAGIYALSKSNVVLRCIVEMEANAGIRTCFPFCLRDVTNADVHVDAFNFKEAEMPLLCVDTANGGYFKGRFTDCTPDSVTLGSMQVTGFGVDYNRVGGVNSYGYFFDIYVKNLRLGTNARVTYGEQTDGVNIQSLGYAPCVGRMYAEEIGEGLDTFGDHAIIDATIKRAHAHAIKLVHGASHNQINCTVDQTVMHGVVLAGSNTASKPVAHNQIKCVAHQIGELGSFANASAVATDGTSATHKPSSNDVEIRGTGNGVSMDYLAFCEAGEDNHFTVDGGGYAIDVGHIGPLAGTGNVITRKRKSFIKAYIGTASTTLSSGGIIPYDTETRDQYAEYDHVTNYRFTATCPGRYEIKAVLRTGALLAGEYIEINIRKNGTPQNRALMYEHSGEAQAVAVADLELNNTDYVDVTMTTDHVGALGLTDDESRSFFEIKQL